MVIAVKRGLELVIRALIVEKHNIVARRKIIG
jgi:hypothetical protein